MKGLMVLLCLLLLVPYVYGARPHIETIFGKTNEQLTRAKVINKTSLELACYLAIDGYKIKFRLPPFQASKWYKATDHRYNHRDFSTWCDDIKNYPEFKKYDIQL